MKAILLKQSKYKKYETIALIKEENDNAFVVAYHYDETETTRSYGNTPAENIFYYNSGITEVEALKQAINKFESINA